jgi:hypothetical protein
MKVNGVGDFIVQFIYDFANKLTLKVSMLMVKFRNKIGGFPQPLEILLGYFSQVSRLSQVWNLHLLTVHRQIFPFFYFLYYSKPWRSMGETTCVSCVSIIIIYNLILTLPMLLVYEKINLLQLLTIPSCIV